MIDPGQISIILNCSVFQVVETKRELYPPENKSHRKEIEETIRTVREKKDQELIKALEDIESRAK